MNYYSESNNQNWVNKENIEDKAIKFSITYKFIFGISLLIFFIVGVYSIYTFRRESDLLQESMDQSGELLASTLALASNDIINVSKKIMMHSVFILEGQDEENNN